MYYWKTIGIMSTFHTQNIQIYWLFIHSISKTSIHTNCMCYKMKLTIMTNTSCFWSFPMHVLDNWWEWRYKTIHLIGHNPSNEMKPLKDSMTPAPDKLYTMFPCMQQCKWICRWLQYDTYYVFGGCLTCMRCQQSMP